MRRLLLLGVLLAGVTGLRRATRGLPAALGAGRAQLRTAAARSPHAAGGVFANTEAGTVVDRRAAAPLLLARLATRDRSGRPPGPVPIVPGVPDGAAAPLAVTWFGHSSVLVEVDGRRILADPVWSERVSPSAVIGPRRMHPVPAALERLPEPDAVLISHDHYDHLDVASIRTLRDRTTAPFVVPLGIGAHLRRWGVPDGRIVELDWGASTAVAGLTLTCAEARHFSGRGLARDTTQWSSWAVAGPRHRAYLGGDTGYTAAFARAGRDLGPFDLTLLPVGAYSDLWPDIHMTPEEAVRAHGDLRGGVLVPVHWATFDLGFHGWAEPVNRLVASARENGVAVAIPRPGQRIDVRDPGPMTDWWNRLRG